MVSRHVERPQIFLDDEAGAFGRDDKTCDPTWVTVFAAGAGENEIVRGDVHPGVPHLSSSDTPAVAVTDSSRFHPGRVRTVFRLGETEGETQRAIENAGYQGFLLFFSAKI